MADIRNVEDKRRIFWKDTHHAADLYSFPSEAEGLTKFAVLMENENVPVLTYENDSRIRRVILDDAPKRLRDMFRVARSSNMTVAIYHVIQETPADCTLYVFDKGNPSALITTGYSYPGNLIEPAINHLILEIAQSNPLYGKLYDLAKSTEISHLEASKQM